MWLMGGMSAAVTARFRYAKGCDAGPPIRPVGERPRPADIE